MKKILALITSFLILTGQIYGQQDRRIYFVNDIDDEYELSFNFEYGNPFEENKISYGNYLLTGINDPLLRDYSNIKSVTILKNGTEKKVFYPDSFAKYVNDSKHINDDVTISFKKGFFFGYSLSANYQAKPKASLPKSVYPNLDPAQKTIDAILAKYPNATPERAFKFFGIEKKDFNAEKMYSILDEKLNATDTKVKSIIEKNNLITAHQTTEVINSLIIPYFLILISNIPEVMNNQKQDLVTKLLERTKKELELLSPLASKIYIENGIYKRKD